MSDHYTAEDVTRALTAALGVEPDSDLTSFTIDRADMIDALDAVAPAIAARALREFADALAAYDSRNDILLTGVSIVRNLRTRADEIEGR